LQRDLVRLRARGLGASEHSQHQVLAAPHRRPPAPVQRTGVAPRVRAAPTASSAATSPHADQLVVAGTAAAVMQRLVQVPAG
jgi:hypothetical protein